MRNEFVGNLVMPDRILYGGKIICEEGMIVDIQEQDRALQTQYPYILPGLIDIHNHGALGHDYMDSTEEAFAAISQYLATHGITCAQCTTMSARVDDIQRLLNAFRRWKQQEKHHRGCCRFTGVHLEGPYLAAESRGAQPLEVLKTPSDGYQWILENADVVKEITLAPELAGMPEMIHDLKEAGIVISGGHDHAEIEDVVAAIDKGMTHCTHIYCAMSTLHKKDAQRKCGLCEYAMTHSNITAEMIADNHHIPPLLAQMIYKCKGPEKLCLVSDAITPTGLPESDTVYLLGAGEDATKVFVEDGVALVEDKSCYAGSIQSLDRMIANLVKDSNIPFVDAVRMATLTPAQVIGIDHECGSLSIGKRADFCFMDSNYSVVKTVIAGDVCYEK